MASNQVNTNPREALAGWRLHESTAWVLLALAMGVGIASWLPKEWTVVRTLLQCVGCFAGGLIIAGKGAIWQRTETQAASGCAEDQGAGTERESLNGWRYHPAAARVMLALVLVGVGGIAWVPKDWELLRAVMQVVGVFAGGMLAARDAAIWQRSG